MRCNNAPRKRLYCWIMFYRKMIVILLLVICTVMVLMNLGPKLRQQLQTSGSHESDKPLPCPAGDHDCTKFQRLLQIWPAGKPKAAIYILTQEKRMYQLEKGLRKLDIYFNNKYDYPVIIFHETDLIPMISEVKNWTKSSVFFQLVNFTVPSFLPKVPDKPKGCPFPIGYRHMCRFHAKQIYEQPIMQGLDFYWRLDDDSLLLHEVKYDLFKFMNIHDLDYGYATLEWDATECTWGLWDSVKTYIQKKHIKTQFFKEWPNRRIVYNNFEISRMSIWLSKDYKKYIDYIDKLGGIYYHRWGDAPIKGIAVSMFVPQNRTHRFSDIGYQHDYYSSQDQNLSMYSTRPTKLLWYVFLLVWTLTNIE